MSRTETAGNLVARAKYYADMENSNFVTDAQWYHGLNAWSARLWSKLIKVDPDRYTREQSLAAGSTDYDTPADYYGTVRVDYISDATQGVYVEIPRLYGAEENRIVQTQANFPQGYTFRYNASAPSTQIIRILPVSEYAMRHLYTVAPPKYATDGTGSAEQIIGIAGFEEYIPVGMAIDAKIREQSSVTELRNQLAEYDAIIDEMAENRSITDAGHVTDTRPAGYYIDSAGIRWARGGHY